MKNQITLSILFIIYDVDLNGTALNHNIWRKCKVRSMHKKGRKKNISTPTPFIFFLQKLSWIFYHHLINSLMPARVLCLSFHSSYVLMWFAYKSYSNWGKSFYSDFPLSFREDYNTIVECKKWILFYNNERIGKTFYWILFE